MTARTTAEISHLVRLACELEANAPKPGNVGPGRGFADTSHDDFLRSAAAIAPVLARAAELPLGHLILEAVSATRAVVGSNTNLGIILLLAPLARAAFRPGTLRAAVRQVLDETTVDDARHAYVAIRLAAPGGLGTVPHEDVSSEPGVTLLQAMMLAADRDAIAREYATSFQGTFERALPALRRAREERLSWSDAIVECYLTLLIAYPDSLIARKLGPEAARRVSDDARAVLDLGGVRTRAGREALAKFDSSVRDPGNARNPGATADLTAAAIFVMLLEHGVD